MHKVEPKPEHHWLQKLIGEWTSEMEAAMGPDKPVETFRGTETVRSLGGLWTLGEAQGEMPGGGTTDMVMTLGFDPAKNRFVGTFVGAMMTHMWLYEGTLDATGNILTLDTEGPGMNPEGAMAKYQDVIEFKSDDERTLTSRSLNPDGTWTQFMSATYRRKK